MHKTTSDIHQRAFARISLLLPEERKDLASALLEGGFHSAVQIASVARPDFLARWNELIPNQLELGEEVYRRSVARRAFVALHYVRTMQSKEPHYRAARFR